MIAEGIPLREIAERLFVSVKTVETHRKKIMADSSSAQCRGTDQIRDPRGHHLCRQIKRPFFCVICTSNQGPAGINPLISPGKP